MVKNGFLNRRPRGWRCAALIANGGGRVFEVPANLGTEGCTLGTEAAEGHRHERPAATQVGIEAGAC
jgi:hypothetical protein